MPVVASQIAAADGFAESFVQSQYLSYVSKYAYFVSVGLTERYRYIRILSSSVHIYERNSGARAEIGPQNELPSVSSIQNPKSRKLNTYFLCPMHCAREENHRKELLKVRF